MHKRHAFSLIELSIVILIIGILIAGVTQGSRLVKQMRLTTARTLTKSSPVSGIKGLTMWLESTSEESFLDAEANDTSPVSQWQDLNPQSISKFLVTASGAARPLYTESGMNGLPVLTFGTNRIMVQNIRGSELFSTDQTTIFVVQQCNGDATTQSSTLHWSGTNRINIHITYNGRIYFDFGGVAATNRINLLLSGTSFYNTPKVLSFIRKSSGYMDFRVNDGTTFSATGKDGVPDLETTAELRIGATASTGSVSLPGMIGEVIIYNRSLTEEERDAVEAYLGKKWGIKFS